MWSCKDHGCALNFYGQIKIHKKGEYWPGSRNAHEEMDRFQKCMKEERRLFLNKHPEGSFQIGLKKAGDLTVYEYTKARLGLIEQRIMTQSALSYPLLEPNDHEKLRAMVTAKKEARVAQPIEGDINADYQEHRGST